jgi:fructose-bisphosphate aldolase class II
MHFVTLGEILHRCRDQKWAVPAFNVVNLETVRAALHGARAERAPVILMMHPNHHRPADWAGLVAAIRSEAEQAGVPVCLHLDHGRNLDQIDHGLSHGLSSVMIDGSTLPLAENIALTRDVVRRARAVGASVEAELGHVGSGEEELTPEEAEARLTRPDQAVQFVAETGIDALAVAIGTAHGLYRTTPRLDIARLEILNRLVPVPLVLHGGSGTPDEEIRRAVAGGICKINIWTDVGVAFIRAFMEALPAPAERGKLPPALAAAEDAATAMIRYKIQLLGASGKA